MPQKSFLEDAVNSFSTKTALEWECRALVSSKPGVIVEELVLATKALDVLEPNRSKKDQLFFGGRCPWQIFGGRIQARKLWVQFFFCFLFFCWSVGPSVVGVARFYTSWGVTIFAENIPFSSGAVMEISRQGHILTTKVGTLW